MRRFEIVQSTTETTTWHAGLALVGRGLAMTGLNKELRQIPLRHGIAHADCVKSYVGLLCTGKSDFDAIENKRNDTFFITALGIERGLSALLGHRYPTSRTKHEREEWPHVRSSLDGCLSLRSTSAPSAPNLPSPQAVVSNGGQGWP